MKNFMYASKNEAQIYDNVINNKGKEIINRILMGTYVKIADQQGDWYKVVTAGPDGWIHKDDLSDNMGLKVFFLDVGQGDGMLVEIGKYKILIDAGPNDSMYSYLTKWQYKYQLDTDKKVHIDFLIISHFDIDHYKGAIEIINDTRFTFGTIVHAGILKFSTKKGENSYSTGLGETIKVGNKEYLTTIFNDLLTINESVPFNRDVTAFMQAIATANEQNRITSAKRVKAGDNIITESIEAQEFRIDVLAPFTENIDDKQCFVYWKDDGQTINGHSLVLKLTYGSRSLLLGGDLNTFSENYLMDKYKNQNPFEVDVAKSCHHGSNDFTEKFMALVNPFATVISSGDNEKHSHPRPDAIGCAGKYSKSIRPLVYSTELARSTDLKNQEILYGMINLRCNGKDIYMAQMNEVKTNSDVWVSYIVK
ncbi:MBL fold metallo-hydrolase [Flavobacterium salmonis]|nr:MBL fold metallo-hydrolase [Flavobacterium salmonis]